MRFLVGSLILAAVVMSTHTALACKCAPPPPPKKALEQSAAVFMGKVTGIEKKGHRMYVTFEVSTIYKGVELKKKSVTVTTGMGGGDCGIRFTEGEVYVVYCYGGKGKPLSTGICSRTKPASKAREDIEALTKATDVG